MISEPRMSLIIHDFSNISDYFKNSDVLKDANISNENLDSLNIDEIEINSCMLKNRKIIFFQYNF